MFLFFLVITACLTPVVIRFARIIDAVDRGGYRKVFQGEMPLLGGLGLSVPLVTVSLLVGVAGHIILHNWTWIWLHHRQSFDLLYSIAESRDECITLAIGGIAITALGVADDVKGLRARWKLLGQMGVACFVCLSGFAITEVKTPFMGEVGLGIALGTFLTIFWIVGLINAFNLIDGIDGLASGIALVGTGAIAVLGIIQDNMFVAICGAALAGSLVAFLFFNFPPAKVFLGDTGSMFIGYILGMLTLTGAQKSETAVIIFAPLLALSLPIFETTVSVVRRYISGVPLFSGDSLHTHHRLLRKGYSQPGVVLTLCGTGLLLATAAIMSALIPEDSRWVWFPYALYLGSLVNVAWLAGYLRPANFEAILERRQRNKVLRAFARYTTLRLRAGLQNAHKEAFVDLCRRELGLHYLELRLEDNLALLVSPCVESDDKTSNLRDEIRVKSSSRQDIWIRYQFEHPPDQSMRQDISLCLASIFDGIVLETIVGTHEAAEELPPNTDQSALLRFDSKKKRGP